MYKMVIKVVRRINQWMYKWNIRRFHKYVMPEMITNLESDKGMSNIKLMFDGRDDETYPIFEPMKKVGTFTTNDIERKLGELANAEE